MNRNQILIAFFISIIGLFSRCSNYTTCSYPFMDWTNPDSIMNSYDTLSKSSAIENHLLVRFWIDPSSTVKQYIEIKDTIGGFQCKKVKYGLTYNKKKESKWIQTEEQVQSKNDIVKVVDKIDSLNLMKFKSRHHSWETDGGPMSHTPMVWYRVEYYKNGKSNDFLFWKFVGYEMRDELKEYKGIVSLIDEEFFGNK